MRPPKLAGMTLSAYAGRAIQPGACRFQWHAIRERRHDLPPCASTGGATYGPFKSVNKNFRGSHVQMFHDKTGWHYDDIPYAAPGTLEQSRTENEHSGYNWSQFDDVNTFEKQY